MKFKTELVCKIEIEMHDAVHILSGPSPNEDFADFLAKHHKIVDENGSYNTCELRRALGKALAEAKISEAKQLTMSSACETTATTTNP